MANADNTTTHVVTAKSQLLDVLRMHHLLNPQTIFIAMMVAPDTQ